MTDELFAGRYRIIRQIGSGGMGVVYEAEDDLLKNIVAIKTIKRGIVREELILRFQREAKALSQLKHPNLVPVFVYGLSDDNEPYMVMRFESGKLMSDLIRGRGRLPIYKSVNIFAQLADAMQHAHANGVLHRDLKPSNILIRKEESANPEVVIIDFGIAMVKTENAMETLTKAGMIMGTPSYMSPEQIRGIEIDERTDIYCLGTIMYEALTGKLPYEAESALELMSMKTSMRAPTLAEGEPELDFPSGLEEIVAKCLALSPEDRYRSMNEFKDALLALKSGDYKTHSHPQNSVAKATDLQNSALKASEAVQLRTRILWLIAIGMIALAGTWVLLKMNNSGKESNPSQSIKSDNNDRKSNPSDGGLSTLLYGEGSRDSMATVGAQSYHLLTKTIKGAKALSLSEAKTDGKASSVMRETAKQLGPEKSKTTFYVKVAFNDVSGTCFKNCPLPISKISVNSCKLSDDGLKAISELPDLQVLEIYNQSLTARGISNLANAKNLKALTLADCDIPPHCLSPLGNLKALNAIAFYHCHYPSNSEKPLNGVDLSEFVSGNPSKLEELTWRRLEISPEGLKSLMHLKNLRVLRLQEVGLKTYELANLEKLHIEQLDISNNHEIGLGAGRHLANLKNLKHLHIDETAKNELINKFPKMIIEFERVVEGRSQFKDILMP